MHEAVACNIGIYKQAVQNRLAYKNATEQTHVPTSNQINLAEGIDAVMAAQVDLVDIAHTLKQVVCVKG